MCATNGIGCIENACHSGRRQVSCRGFFSLFSSSHPFIREKCSPTITIVENRERDERKEIEFVQLRDIWCVKHKTRVQTASLHLSVLRAGARARTVCRLPSNRHINGYNCFSTAMWLLAISTCRVVKVKRKVDEADEKKEKNKTNKINRSAIARNTHKKNMEKCFSSNSSSDNTTILCNSSLGYRTEDWTPERKEIYIIAYKFK